MKFLKKFSFIPVLALAMACNNSAPTESVETGEAEEVTSPEESTEVQKYSVMTEGDEVMWKGYKTYAEGSHHGTLQVSDGNFTTEGNKIVGGEFTLDMTTIHSVDLKDDKEMYGKLVGHLKSKDFFAVDSFPTAKFEVTEVKEATNDTTGATHHVSGNLTMRGITKNITIPAKISMGEDMMKFSTPQFVIDRSKWNVRFRSTSFAEFADVAKDKAIDNNIKLEVSLKAKKA